MAELDPVTGKPKRRSLVDIAQSGQYPGAVPAIASLLPTAPTTFTDSTADPNKPYLGGQRQAPAYAPSPLAVTSTPAAQSVSPLAPTNAYTGEAQGHGLGNRSGALRSGPLADSVGPSVAVQPDTGTKVDYRQSLSPGIAQNIGDPGQYGSVLSIPTASMAALSPETARALSAAKFANVANDEYGSAPGYRGSLAPGRGIAGDFDFATNAARDFAARSSDPRERAKLAGLNATIAQRDAEARGDVPLAEYARNQLANAQAGEATGRAANLAALAPSEIQLRKSQSAEALGRTSKSLADTSSTLALQPGQVEAQGTTNAAAKLALQQQQQLQTLATKALSSGKPEDFESYAAAVRAAKGQGGNITPEDLLKAYAGYLDAHTKSIGPLDAGRQPLSFQDFSNSVSGKAPTAPAGMKQVGTSGGKPVYEDSNGKRFIGG